VLRCNTLQHTFLSLWHTATHCNTHFRWESTSAAQFVVGSHLEIAATHCNTHFSHCNTMQTLLTHVSRCCNTLQHSATHCKTQIKWEPSVLRSSSWDLILRLLSKTRVCNTLQHTSLSLQHTAGTATHISLTATRCNILQHRNQMGVISVAQFVVGSHLEIAHQNLQSASAS